MTFAFLTLSFFGPCVCRGGVGKGPAPVKSLRDLMQEEEQRQSKKETAFQEMAPASTSRISSASGKSMSARKKLKYVNVLLFVSLKG